MSSKASFSIPVKAEMETLWSVLVDKAENPGRYVPGFIDSEILERTHESMLCRLHTDRFDILERITVDESTHKVSFDLLDHPHYTGILINRIEDELSEDGYPILNYSYDWVRREGIDNGDDMSDIVKTALQRTRDIAEEKQNSNK